MADAVQGNLTKIGVSDDGVTFEPICVFGGETTVDYGTYTTNKEYCLSDSNPFVSLGDLEFGDQTFTYLWSEGAGDAANVIIKAAFDATDLVGSTITIQTEANNSAGVNGTQYEAEYLVTGYKHLFKKGEVNKTEFSVTQTTTPTEVVAA